MPDVAKHLIAILLLSSCVSTPSTHLPRPVIDGRELSYQEYPFNERGEYVRNGKVIE